MAIGRLVNKRTGEELFGDAIDLETGESQSIAAAKSGNVGDLKLLHERHANFNYQDPDGWTALMTACATHHVDCARYLISCNADLELVAKDGWTALMIAIDHNQEEIVKALLDAGAKTGRFNYSGACELCIAAKYPRLAELLLEHGANPNQPHPRLPLVKPLFLTLSHCKDVHPDFVRTLVKHGAEVNAQTKEGQTPLMVSVMNAGITKVLLESGADPSFHDQDGETALDYAKKPGVDPRAYEILKTAIQKMDDGRNAKDTDVSIVAERVGKRYDEICAYFSDNPFGSNPSDLTILSLLPPIDRCLIIERILKLNNSDRLTCIDKLSMAYLKAGLRDVAFEFIKQCDKCGWFNNQPNRCPYPQWDYDFFADKLNGLVVGNVSVSYDDTLRKFPDYDSGSQFCGLVKQLSVEYKGHEVLKGDESPEVLEKFRDERLAYIKGLPNMSNPIKFNSANGEQTDRQEMCAGVSNPLNEAMQDKDIERKTSPAIDKKTFPEEPEKSAANEAIFTSETNCTINIDDIKSLTIFCDKYGATLTVGDSQLVAWYKVDIKAGKQAKGAYAFEGYAYISGKDFLKLKPILLKRGWEFHSAKSGSPWFAEGESAVCPKEVKAMSQPVNIGEGVDERVSKDGCVNAKECSEKSIASNKPKSSKDESQTIGQDPTKQGDLLLANDKDDNRHEAAIDTIPNNPQTNRGCFMRFLKFVLVMSAALMAIVGIVDEVNTLYCTKRLLHAIQGYAPVTQGNAEKIGAKEVSRLRKQPKHGDVARLILPGGESMEMIYCAPSTFLMGSPLNEAGRGKDETQHRVTLTKGFWLSKNKVSQSEWIDVMGVNPSDEKGFNLPVAGVSWMDCSNFVAKINAKFQCGARLPTEAEWEYACREAISGSCSFVDMQRGLMEWCDDWYTGDYSVMSAKNPKGENACDTTPCRVLRGGDEPICGIQREYPNKYIILDQKQSRPSRRLRNIPTFKRIWRVRERFALPDYDYWLTRRNYPKDSEVVSFSIGFRLCCNDIPGVDD